MIRDEDLKSSTDYSAGQTAAAHRVLVELVNLFDEYKDEIRIVGGWVPELMYPGEGHVGSVDVDILITHLKLKESGYQTMSRILLNNGYREHPEKYFSFVKTLNVDGKPYDVDVDILAGMYGGSPKKKRSQHVQGIKALKASGGDFAFGFEAQKVKVEASRPDGAIDVAHVNLIAVVPYFVMKTAAMGRGKAKDAYDIYFLIKHYPGRVEAMAKLFEGVKNTSTIVRMKEKLAEKFGSVDHAGPLDVSSFLEAEGDESDYVKRDAYELIQALISMI